MKNIVQTLCLFLFLLNFNQGYSQIEKAKTNDQVEILLKDGNRIVGQIKSINQSEIVVISSSLGELTIQKDNISQITYVNRSEIVPDKNGFRTDFHNSTHYFVLPSAYVLKPGQRYYENISLFLNSFTFGVSKNFSFTVGGEIASLLFGSQFPIIYVAPKFSIPTKDEKGAFGLSTIVFSSPENDFNAFGTLIGTFTLGGRNNNFSVGAGYGFDFDSGLGDEFVPFLVSYMGRLSDNISFVTDNIFIFNDAFLDNISILSAGVRIHFKKDGAALNLALWRTTEDQGSLFAFPFVSATIPMRNSLK